MNWFSQLTRLIFDFYREDPAQLAQLRQLESCKLSRRSGVLRVDCRDFPTADAIVAAGALLKEPIAQLRLAHQINIMVKGSLLAALPVDVSKSSRLSI